MQSRGNDLRGLAFALVASMVVVSPAVAEDRQVKEGPVPSWVTQSDLMPAPEKASGAAVFRRQDILVHLDAQGQQQYVGYRLKLLQPGALDAGNISISWNPAAGSPIVHSIKVFRADQAIDVMKSTSFEILRREDQLEAAKLDGMLTAVLRVPDLRVGDELEVSYTVRVSDPTLGNDDAGLLLLGPSPLPGRYRLKVSWDDGRKPNLKLTPDLAAATRSSDHAVEVTYDNPPILTPPKDAPSRYQWQRMIEYSSFSEWAGVSRRIAPLFAKAAALPPRSPLQQEASRIAAANPTAFERASAALKLVQQDIRYIYVGLDRGNLTPATADETWQRRYGDCKAKTALLLALLNTMGIEAQPVLVNNGGADDGLDQHLPSPRLFDHVLVRARIDGTWYWLDGTMPSVVAPGKEPTLPYRWFLPLDESGSALQPLAWHPEDRPDEINLMDIDARSGFDQNASVVSTTIVRGIDGLKQQVQFSTVTADQLFNAFRQNLVGGNWQAIDDVKWHYDEKAQASVLTITGKMKLDWEDDGSGARSLALPGGGFSPPERRGRPSDQDQDAPYSIKPSYNCYVTTVHLPSTTRSRQWASKPSYDTHIFGRNFYRMFGLKDGAIRMIRGSRTERNEIDAATAKADNNRIAAFDNSMGYIFYDPAGQSNPIATNTNVPAVNDIDWTRDDVPCVAASSRAVVAK